MTAATSATIIAHAELSRVVSMFPPHVNLCHLFINIIIIIIIIRIVPPSQQRVVCVNEYNFSVRN
jgi:hypothetical protein